MPPVDPNAALPWLAPKPAPPATTPAGAPAATPGTTAPPDPNQLSIEKLIQQSRFLPEPEKQKWLKVLPKLTPEKSAELKQIFVEEALEQQKNFQKHQPELIKLQKDYLEKIKTFKHEKTNELLHQFEEEDAKQMETKEKEVLKEIEALSAEGEAAADPSVIPDPDQESNKAETVTETKTEPPAAENSTTEPKT